MVVKNQKKNTMLDAAETFTLFKAWPRFAKHHSLKALKYIAKLKAQCRNLLRDVHLPPGTLNICHARHFWTLEDIEEGIAVLADAPYLKNGTEHIDVRTVYIILARQPTRHELGGIFVLKRILTSPKTLHKD